MDLTVNPALVVEQIISGVDHSAPEMTPGRYPFTYAYDFYKAHGFQFGETEGGDWQGSRGAASARLNAYCDQTGVNKGYLSVLLAEGYLAEHGYAPTTEEKVAALAANIIDAWKPFGYDQAPDVNEARAMAADLIIQATQARRFAAILGS